MSGPGAYFPPQRHPHQEQRYPLPPPVRHHPPPQSFPSASSCGNVPESPSLYNCVKCGTVIVAGGRWKAKLLPCLHVICVPCMAGQANNASRSFNCPSCRFHCRSEDAVDHVIPEVSGGPKDLKCQASNCPDRGIAIVFCEHCHEALCTGCMSAHKRVTATRNHSLKEYHRNPIPPKMLCPSHPTDMLHYFCQNCQKGITHKLDEQFVKHQEAARIERERFQELVQKNNKRLLNLKSSKHVVHQRLDEVDKAEKELRVQLRTAIVQLQDAITNRGSQLLADIQRGAQSKRDQYLRNKADVDKITGMLEQAQNIAEEVLKTKVLEFYPNHMLEIKRMLSMHLERVREVKFDMNSLQHQVQMSINVQALNDLRERISSFGQVQIRGQESASLPPPPPHSSSVQGMMGQGPQRMPPPNSQPHRPPHQRFPGPQLSPRGPLSPPLQGLGAVPQQFSQTPTPRPLTLPTVPPPVSMGHHGPQMMRMHPPRQMAPPSHQSHHAPQPQLMNPVLHNILSSSTAGPRPAMIHRGQPPMLLQAPRPSPVRGQSDGRPLPPLVRYRAAGPRPQVPLSPPVTAETLVRSLINEQILPHNGLPPHCAPSSEGYHSEEFLSDDDFRRNQLGIEDVQVLPSGGTDHGQGTVPGSEESGVYLPSTSNLPVMARKSVSKPRSLADVVSSLQRTSATNSPAPDAQEERHGDSSRPGVSHSPGSLRLVLSKRQDGRYSPVPQGGAQNMSEDGESESGRGNRRDTPDASLVTTTSQNSKESDDWCAVCQNGCDESDPQDVLLVCDGKDCPRVFHTSCHIPEVKKVPPDNEEWLCTFCTNAEPLRTDLDNLCDGKRGKREFLTDYERKLCQKLLLELSVNPNGVEFHYPVAKEVKDYYEIIKRPVDLSLVARRLDLTKRPYPKNYYRSVRAFVDDLNRMFRNCSRYNKPDSEVGIAGHDLWTVFKNLVEAYFPDLTEFVWDHQSLYVDRDEQSMEASTGTHLPGQTEEEVAGPSKKRSRFGTAYYSSDDEMDDDFKEDSDMRKF